MKSTTNLIGTSLCLIIGVVAAPTKGQTLIWNNEFGHFGTGASHHAKDPYNSLLDDFNFDQPVIMTDFSMLFIWTTGGVDKGERVELTLWSDSRGEPDEPFFIATLMAYEEIFTGEILWGRELLDIHQQVKPFLIAPGPTWLEMHEVGSENGFQLMTFVNDEPGWVCFEYFPPCPRPGGEVFGFDTDYSYMLFGFIPGEAAEGFIRIIDPVLFSGEPQGGVEDIREDDDSYYVLHAGQGIQVSRAHSARVIFETTLPDLPLDRMDLRVQSIGTRPNVRQEILLFDFDANSWVILDNRPLPNTGPDLVVTIENLPEPERFINDSDGRTRLHVEAYSGPSISPIPHQLKVNKVNFVLTYTP